ncbi:MAG: hypothetical protein DLM52_09915, partial [Chthoniobacterales bacterium]
MIGKTHRRFWKAFEKLPGPIQKLAREKYALWKSDPFPCSQCAYTRNSHPQEISRLARIWFAFVPVGRL